MPSARLAPQAERLLRGPVRKLNSTESVSVRCDTGNHDGATNTSRGPQSNDWPPIVVVPRPSTAQNTVESVERTGAPVKPFGSHCTNAPMVGIG